MKHMKSMKSMKFFCLFSLSFFFFSNYIFLCVLCVLRVRGVSRPDPERPHAVYQAEGFDFRLKPGSRAVDAGCRLPNINDGYTGKAPDLGAYELGKPLPVYGPRAR